MTDWAAVAGAVAGALIGSALVWAYWVVRILRAAKDLERRNGR